MNLIRIVNNIAVVTATADYDPLHKLSNLEVELKKYKFEGTVLFDLLCINGLCDNRFIELLFNGREFNRTSYKVKISIDTKLKSHQDNYFYSHPHILNSSVLSSKEVKYFNNNIKDLTSNFT